MPDNKQLYNEFADISSLENQKKEILSIFSDVKAGILSLAEAGVKIDNSKSIRQIQVAEKEYNAELKQTQNFVKQLADTEAKLLLVRQKETLQLTENKLRLKELNKEQNERLRIQNAEKGSIEELSLKYDKAYRIYKQLSEAQRNGDRGQALNKFLADTSTKLKELEGGVGNFRRNVGNYAGSLAKPFETLINKVEELKANLKNGIGLGGKTDVQSLQQAGQAITIIETAIAKSSSSGTTSVKQVKDLSNAYRDLSITLGKADGTTFLSTLKAEVGEAKDEVADLNDELKLAASDTQGIDNVVGSLNALAGVAQGAAGAYALFGASEEDAAKVTSKLIAVQGIANSIQQVGQELTRKGTTANKAYIYVQGLVTTATNTTATATARLNAILKLSTIGLVIGLIGGLIYMISKITSETSEYAKKQQVLNDLKKEGNKTAAEELTKLKLVYAGTQNLNASTADRVKAAKFLQETYPETFKNFTVEEILLGKAKNGYDLLTASILKNALAQAGRNKLTELGQQELDAFSDYASKRKELERSIPRITKTDDQIAKENGLVNASQIATFKRNASIVAEARRKDINQLSKDYADRLKVIKDNQKTVIDFVGAQNLVDEVIGKPKEEKKEKKSEAKKVTDNTAADILKSIYERNKLILENEAESSKAIFENEKKSYEDRLDALRIFTGQQLALIKLEQQYELDQEELKMKEIRGSLQDQLKEKGADKKAINEQLAKEEDASIERIVTITLKGNSKIAKAYEDSLVTLKKINADKVAAQATFGEQMRAQYEKAFAEFKAAEAKMLAEQEKVKAQKLKSYDDMKSAIIKSSEEVQATVLFFLTASIDAEIAAIDTKTRLNDEATARRINQINLLGLSEQERVKETAKVEKQAQFEREELERRRRKLLVDRARFEKLANVASIISNTALAVMTVLSDKTIQGPFKIAMAAIVGGIGALQLARAVAAPLPQYFKGTDNAKRGLALVSEQGPELMSRNGQLFLTPNQPTLMEMAGGERITPAHLTRDILNSLTFNKTVKGNGLVLLQAQGISSSQADTMITEIKDLKKETAKSRTNLSFHFDSTWNTYITKNIK